MEVYSHGTKLVECPLCADNGLPNQTNFTHNSKDEIICKKCSTPLDSRKLKTNLRKDWWFHLITAVILAIIIYLVA